MKKSLKKSLKKRKTNKTKHRKIRHQKTRKHLKLRHKKQKTKKTRKHRKNKKQQQHNLFDPIYSKKEVLHSYSPTINKRLVTLKSISREKLHNCNIKQAYKLHEPLEVGIPGYLYGKTCYNYNSPEAKHFLLHNLSANKHIDITKIVPPKQIQSNCWFNVMFAMFFISDKGRKFFHFFRQLMIEGKQSNGVTIPENIRNAFALLNFGIDACLTGNKFAYELNTNAVIHQLYKSIPEQYREQHKYITGVDEAGNPLQYYISIINYLSNSPILLIFIKGANANWKEQISAAIAKNKHLPHIIAIEIYKDNAHTFKKPHSFTIKDAKYALDSAAIIDTSQQHFCATITCEGKEMGYDGMSHHPLIPYSWKNKINSNYEWGFDGTLLYDNGPPMKWNFMKCYQILMYYRV